MTRYLGTLLVCILLFGLVLQIAAERSRRQWEDEDEYEDSPRSRKGRNNGVQNRRPRRGKNARRDDESRQRRQRRNRWNRRVARKRRGRKRRDSESIHALEGVLKIKVVGTGDACLQTIRHRTKSYKRQFGDATNAWAFIDLYGLGHCEEGAVGRAYGMVKAWVVAEAYEIGEECLANVITNVLARVHDPDPHDGVSVTVGGIADGEALAICGNKLAPYI